ncbi:sulfite exporter TauE/SafE family protein [Patescibacteria group bacterium]|nr:sulfite exporter TauE/SafE family protein [Patescibacteria group bacterium]
MSEKFPENSQNIKKIYIDGMTCVSCETIIADKLKGIEGIDEVSVCHKKRIAEFSYKDKEPDLKKIAEKIKELGYQASLNPFKGKGKQKTTAKQWLYSILIVAGLYLLYRLFSYLGLLSWLNIEATNITYSVAFLIGIVASMSSCLVVVGAVVISFSAKYQTKGSFYQTNIKPHFLFHFGRLATFFILGGFLGIIGGWLNFSSAFIGWFSVVIAVVLAWLGLNILGVLPSLSTIGIRLPKGSMKIWSNLKESEHALAPIILGGFTFFLPCGFTQSMQLFAMSSGSFWTGAITMFLFALGTAPILIGLGITTARFKNTKTAVFQKAVGFIVILFSLYTVSSGFALAGINIDLLNKKVIGATAARNNIQVIEMNVSYGGFSPNVFKIKKGIPVKWLINGQQVSGCTNEIISPSLGIKQKIYPGENIIEFTPDKTGTIGFSCWMGMVRGKFIIEEGETNSSNYAPSAIQDNSLNTGCSGGGVCGGTCGAAGCGCGASR